MQELYAQRLDRYVTAMRNGKPDRVPVRPFVAEFTAKYAGYTCQEVTHDYRNAFEAVIKCGRDFDWDAMVGNMVYVWTGLTQATGLHCFATPGIGLDANTAFQYREPAEDAAFMRREEYDELIEDPTRFLYEVWLPRVSTEVTPRGQAATYRNNLALVKGGMSMLSYFMAFGPQIERMKNEAGMPSAISGMLKAPLDIIGDKLRGYIALSFDLMEMPDKVLAACKALMPHLGQVAISGLDPQHQIPIPIWMHRGCVPFVSHKVFNEIYWPTLRPILDSIWARGNQVLLYAEGKWDAHLDTFAQLPAGSVIYHIDRGDIDKIGKALGGKFCLSGGIPNALLAFGTPEQVRARCQQVLDTLGANGGYIMDASAILQNDASIENIRVMTDFTHEYGVYGHPQPAPVPQCPASPPPIPFEGRVPPGVCVTWEEKLKDLPEIVGDAAICKKVWDDLEGLAYTYIWHTLLM